MKTTHISLCLLCALFLTPLLGGTREDEMIFPWHGGDKAVALSPEEQSQSVGKDAIVTAKFAQGAGADIRKEQSNYLGIRRAGAGSQDTAYSCAGGLGGELVFARSSPGSHIGKNKDLVPGDPVLLCAPEGVSTMISLNQIADALDLGLEVAITLLRTPAEEAYDIIAVSVWDPTNLTFADYAIGMKISASTDTGSFDEADFYKQRFVEGGVRIAENYQLEDALDITHKMIVDNPDPIPEPSASGLMLLGLSALCSRRRRR